MTSLGAHKLYDPMCFGYKNTIYLTDKIYP